MHRESFGHQAPWPTCHSVVRKATASHRHPGVCAQGRAPAVQGTRRRVPFSGRKLPNVCMKPLRFLQPRRKRSLLYLSTRASCLPESRDTAALSVFQILLKQDHACASLRHAGSSRFLLWQRFLPCCETRARQ